MHLYAVARDAMRSLAAPRAARALQDALDAQAMDDLAEVIRCGDCGGLGVVTDYDNPLDARDIHWTGNGKVYGAKVCPRCKGTGSN